MEEPEGTLLNGSLIGLDPPEDLFDLPDDDLPIIWDILLWLLLDPFLLDDL